MKVRNNRKNRSKKNLKEHMSSDETSEPQPGDPVTSDEWKSIGILIAVCTVLIILSFCAAFFTQDEGFATFMGFAGDAATIGGILVGFVSSTIFGLIDNGGLYFGMSSLDPIFRSMKMDDLESAGWGNTFSDFLGAFLGTFIGKFVEKMSGVEKTALWSEVIGIVLGCILGIYIPKVIKHSSVNVDVNLKTS